MKKFYLFNGLLVIMLLINLACASKPKPRPLDLKTLSGDIPVYSLNLLVNKNIDTDRQGNTVFEKLFLDNINKIHSLLAEKGINFDVQAFLKEYNSSKKAEFDEMVITPSFVIHRYFWQSEIKTDLRMTITINFVQMEDGTMPMTVTINKDDPDYEPGYSAESSFKVKFD